MSTKVVKDWENRELTEIIELNIQQLASFLNNFDTSVKFELSKLNEKLTKLERSIDYCEVALKSSKEDKRICIEK